MDFYFIRTGCGAGMKILGIDGGIASVGWAYIDHGDADTAPRICGLGTWMFNAPEDKGRAGSKLKSAARRTARGQRRVIRRRHQRMNDIRRLLHKHGLLEHDRRDALKHPGFDPWQFRTDALKRELSPLELAVALGHIGRHRGFKSNAKGDKSANAPDESKKMLSASDATREKLSSYRTPAEMLLADDSFVLRSTAKRDGTSDEVRRLRNREGDYSRSLLRNDLETETKAIFDAQRRFGCAHANIELEKQFIHVAFFQRPLQNSEALLGYCPFEPAEKRSAKRGYSFELFRYLSRLNNLKIIDANGNRRSLTPNERQLARADFAHTATISFAGLRRKIGLSPTSRIEGVKPNEEGKRDLVARAGEAAAGTSRLRKLILEHHGDIAWQSLLAHPERLDRLAEVISFREDLDDIECGLREIPLADEIIETLLAAVRDSDALGVFTGAAHLSAKAVRAILPGLLAGMTYDKACQSAGYDHTDSIERHAFDVGVTGKEAIARILREECVSRELIGSPTARKAVIEMLKQIKAVIEIHGMPDRIHIELARDIGKSIEERDQIEKGIERRNKQKEKVRELFADKIGRPPQSGGPGAEELQRFELWEQQNGRCLYTDEYISPGQIVAGDNSVQVDHILPWSRFGDDSFHNKTLCTTQANQEKKGRTPYEWFSQDKSSEDWDRFVAAVDSVPYMKGMKRRNYLLRDADERAEKFKTRNLNDTRWACRLLAEALRQVLPDEKDENGKMRRRIFSRPGALTNLFRRAWGLQWVKKDEKGDRLPDDRHHALDALIVAVIDEGLLNRATREVQTIEGTGLPYDLTKNIDQPWSGFRDQAIIAADKVFVARAERRRARGKAHDATIRQIKQREGQNIVYERKKVADLKPADLGRVKDKDRNAKLIENLSAWMADGKPADSPPLSPKGDPIAKVRLISNAKVNIPLYHGGADNPPGTVDRGEMARVDVFHKADKKGKLQYYLVPVYPHQIATLDAPPDRAVAANKAEGEWPLIDSSYQFLWSLAPMSYVRVVTKNGEIAEGYFRGLDRATGALAISVPYDSTDVKKGIGARTLLEFKKYTIDRLGRAYSVEREIRTWHGKACT